MHEKFVEHLIRPKSILALVTSNFLQVYPLSTEKLTITLRKINRFHIFLHDFEDNKAFKT